MPLLPEKSVGIRTLSAASMTFCRAWYTRSPTWASLSQTFRLAITCGWYGCSCEHLASMNERDCGNVGDVNIRQRIRYRTWQAKEMMNWEECWKSTEWANQSIVGNWSLIDAFINDTWHEFCVTICSVHLVNRYSDKVSFREGISRFLLILIEHFQAFVLGFQIVGLSQFSQRRMSPEYDSPSEKTFEIEQIYFSSAAVSDPKCRIEDSSFKRSASTWSWWWCKCVSFVASQIRFSTDSITAKISQRDLVRNFFGGIAADENETDRVRLFVDMIVDCFTDSICRSSICTVPLREASWTSRQ
jgi:hypothetical protein